MKTLLNAVAFTLLLSCLAVLTNTACAKETKESDSRQYQQYKVVSSAVSGEEQRKQTALSPAEFQTVPAEVKPWVYYWWLKANVTPELITKDLEAMSAKGVGGILLFDSRYYHDEFDSKTNVPVPLYIRHEFMNPEWRKLVLHTIREADRLGMKVSMNISDSGGVLRGPWDLKEDGPKELVWTEENVNGPKKITKRLTRSLGQKFYKDVALLAVRVKGKAVPERENVRLNQSWGNAVCPDEQSEEVLETVDLAPFVKKSVLTWKVPEGAWKIIRFGRQVVGDVGSVDILDREVVTSYYERMCGQIVKDAGPLAGKTLTHFYNVSWEGSNPDWSNSMEAEFAKRRKYDLRPVLPVLRGMIIGDLDRSVRIFADFHRTVSDCFRENCYQTIGELCHRDGIIWHSEDGGDWRRTSPLFEQADMLSFWGQNDIPQGEFWVSEEAFSRKSNMRHCAMAAHIYGKTEVACEAFTHMERHWSMYPAWLKRGADLNFIDGTNMMIWHTFTASLPELGKPGFEYFAGSHINRNVTWWEQVGPFMTYMGRCQYLLRKGKYVADVCVYTSDRNYVGRGSRGEQWNPDSDLILPPGYTYDLLDTNVLVHHLQYKEGRLVLPHGMSYRLLVLDLREDRVPAEAMMKIAELVRQGATVVLGKRQPVSTPGMTDSRQAAQRLKEAVSALWGEQASSSKVSSKVSSEVSSKVPAKVSSKVSAKISTEVSTKVSSEPKKSGKGKIYRNSNMSDVFAAEKILPDFAGPYEYLHRSTGSEEIYFVAGSGSGDAIFRVTNKTPRIWDPVSGKVYPVTARTSTDDGRTKISLQLPDRGSLFVVFANEGQYDSASDLTGPNGVFEYGDFQMTGERNGKPAGIFWKGGTWNVERNGKKRSALAVNVPAPLDLSDSWKVSFDPQRGGPEQPVTFDRLTRWDESDIPGIRFYSGPAVYRKTFTLTDEQAAGPIRLATGEVHQIAEVTLNGKNEGILWTAPWTLDLKNSRKGENILEIKVVNCWVNRLIGDAAVPKEKRITKTNIYLEKEPGKLRRHQGIWANEKLLPAGLVGPVRIVFGKETDKLKR